MRILIAFLLCCSMSLAAQKGPAPDAIFFNGEIYRGSGVGAARGDERRSAMAVRNDRIVAVGSDAEVRKLAGKKTELVDLGGRFVVAGFNDAHLHLASGGQSKLRVDLTGARSLEDFKQRIAFRARELPADAWLRGRGWDHTLWPGQQLPTRQDVDAVSGGHPAHFVRVDGHIAIANSAALKWAGITRDTPDPAGGKIDRDENGEPNGILRESAKEALEARLPPLTPAERRRGMELALEEAARWGVTSAQDILDSWEDFLVYEELEREGKLTARITAWLPLETPLELLQKRRAHHDVNDPRLQFRLLKAYTDGSLGSRTALLFAPYSDDPKNTGIVRWPQVELDRTMLEATRAGFQVGFHSIGDRGAQMALDAIAQATRDARRRSGKDPELRARIEHCQVIAPQQFAQFRDLSVVASVQPNHLLTDMRWAEARIGPQRAKTSYPWREFLAHGVRLAFGTDYPVEPLTPFRGLYAAVTRMDEAGKASYYPDQKVAIEDAIAAYTIGSAYAEFAEKDKGTLQPGMLADFVVLDRDLTKIPPAQILETKVLQTWVGGKKVYHASAPPATSD